MVDRYPSRLAFLVLAGLLVLAPPVQAQESGSPATGGAANGFGSLSDEGCPPDIAAEFDRASTWGREAQIRTWQDNFGVSPYVREVSCIDDILNMNLGIFFGFPDLESIFAQYRNRICSMIRDAFNSATGVAGRTISTPQITLPGGVTTGTATAGTNRVHGNQDRVRVDLPRRRLPVPGETGNGTWTPDTGSSGGILDALRRHF